MDNDSKHQTQGLNQCNNGGTRSLWRRTKISNAYVFCRHLSFGIKITFLEKSRSSVNRIQIRLQRLNSTA